jgi:hypothetical protein
MSLEITRVLIGGANVLLDSVLADVTIHHGRADTYEDASASTAQVTLLEVTRKLSRAFTLGQTLEIYAAPAGGGAEIPRFTGRITDGGLDDDSLTALAVGRYSTLSQYSVGAGDWPAEAWSARVSRIFTEAGLSAYLELQAPPAGSDPQLAARVAATDGGPVVLSDYLSQLALTVGAAVADRPNGDILVQAISARSLASMVTMDPRLVEYVPVWVIVLPGGNIVTVKYAGGAAVTLQDDGSIAIYGPRPLSIDTTLATADDATARAMDRMSRGAYSHWNIPAAPLLEGMDLSIGQPIKLLGFPPASPYSPWTPILEGWTDHVTSNGETFEWRMELALADPLLSGLTLPWEAVPLADKWNTINQTTAWKDALTLDSLEDLAA